MEEKNNKKKRNRRTNYEVDRDIMAALKGIVEKVGFSNITLSAVSHKAKVEPQVIYNRFGDLNGLLEKFVEKYNYWLNDVLENYISDFNESKHEEFLSRLMGAIALGLYKDRSMQQLLIWEVLENNSITSRTAKNREANTHLFTQFYQNLFKDTDANFNVLTAIVISGIYYLILHKDASTFCDVDFNTPAGKEQLLGTINKIYSWLFSELQSKKEVLDIARRMKKDGIDNNLISKYTGLTIEEVTKVVVL